MEREDIEAVQAALSDLQQDWASALDSGVPPSDAAAARAEQAAQRQALRAEQDAAFEAQMAADLLRRPPAPPEPCRDGGIAMKVRFPDGSAEVFLFAPTAPVREVVQLAQSRMRTAAPMAIRVQGRQRPLEADDSLAAYGLTTPHVLVAAWPVA